MTAETMKLVRETRTRRSVMVDWPDIDEEELFGVRLIMIGRVLFASRARYSTKSLR